MTRTRKATQRTIGWKDGVPTIKAEELIYTFDELLRKWIKRKGKTYYETVEQNGWSKSVELVGLIKREATNLTTLKPIIAYFTQKFIVKVPRLNEYKFVYLQKTLGKVYKRDFKLDYTTEVDLTDADFVRKIGTPKRISIKTASKMLRGKEIYPLLLIESGKSFQFEIP